MTKKDKETLKDKIIDGKMTRVQAVTEIKNQLRRKKEKKAVEDYKKSIENDTYHGDGTEWIVEKDKDGTIYKRMMGSDKRENVR
ncbi:hypothetical protein OAC91_00055 [Candidatus Marinimicrobia bacterium]|jgi:hypothetical protein|nr:hypothetical protein [Candidatus Neomarinimicrobiota bacterium]|tara:strand:- start:203 stop:454 length:252 start_codon:yes stop_codon:yes gene_type:complete